MTQTRTKITAENQMTFPIGQRVRFFWGAMFPTEEGRVTGYAANAGGPYLGAVTDEGEPHTITEFVTIGIGVYLI